MKKKITKKIDVTVNGNSFEIDASELSAAIKQIEEANRGKKTTLSIKGGDKKLTISATVETEDDGEKDAKYKVESGDLEKRIENGYLSCSRDIRHDLL